MGYEPSDHARPRLTTTKIVIAGGFGVGKTTMVASVSEIRPLLTEEPLTERGIGVDDVALVDDKTTTTVAMDFGRITIRDDLVLYLFGTPGQDRFWFMWDEMTFGAMGAVVLADTRRLTTCFPAIDYFEERGIPFLVAVNCFPDTGSHETTDIAIALDLDPHVPVLLCDVRQRLPDLDAYLANATNIGFAFVFAGHWIGTGGAGDVAGVREAAWAVQRVLRLLNDLGSIERDRKWGDLNALLLGAGEPAVRARLAELKAEVSKAVAPIPAELADYLVRQVEFCTGFYGVTDFWVAA
jgi:signal recognition particle receptor subunit beta